MKGLGFGLDLALRRRLSLGIHASQRVIPDHEVRTVHDTDDSNHPHRYTVQRRLADHKLGTLSRHSNPRPLPSEPVWRI
jgi:hypothetical protein